MEATLTEKAVGLFLAKFQIGGEMPGAKSFKLQLAVDTPHESISGIGEITQATNPPLDIKTKLNGDYTYMCVMPKNCHILVVATGYPIIKWPAHGGVGPVIPPNVHLRMVLSEDWKTGTANYQYMDSTGNWQSVQNAPVSLID